MSNKLIAYYCTKEWDTALDTKATQRRRVTDWALKNRCEVIEEFGDGDLDRAFEKAFDIGARVIVSDISRLADRTKDFLEIAEDSTKPFVSSDNDQMEDAGDVLADMSRFTSTVLMVARQKYIAECEQWLV